MPDYVQGDGGLEHFAAADREVWRQWLAAHHADAAGVWLVFARKGSGIPSVRYAEVERCSVGAPQP